MTLEEEIKRYTDNAEYERTHGNLQGCLDFRQLADWLKELKKYRAIFEKVGKILADSGYTIDDLDTIFGKVNREVNADDGVSN